MTLSATQLRDVTASEWVHMFEEDAAGDEIYRPAAADTPAARRPRERLRLLADGSAQVSVGGPDDRSRALAATWTPEGEDIVIRIPNGPPTRSTYRIALITADRLTVRVS